MVDKMESSERGSVDAAEASSDAFKKHQSEEVLGHEPVLPCPDVEAGSNSTDEGVVSGAPTSTNFMERDGSVVSAMTDLASLEGPMVPSLLGEEETSSQQSSELHDDHDVPQQVILPEDLEPFPHIGDGSSPPPIGSNCPSPTVSEETPLVVLSTKQSRRINSIITEHETISLPERQRAPQQEASESSNRSAATEADTATAVRSSSFLAMKESSAEEEDDGGMDDYIRSPEVQNAIVERSPGGRYVRFMEKLGSGASKDVYRAYDTQEGIEVAWNVVNLSGVPKTERNRIVNEVRLLERLHHENIISFHGSWVNRERQEVNFVTEILSSGTLKSFINKVQVIRWKIAKRWAFQILKGLDYLHSQDPPVIHRDLKCENIFINGTSGDLRIGDLGLSTVHRNGRVLSVLGTPEFMAPDMYEENSYNEKVDVYAFGMCLLEIFTKEIPYSECNNPAQIYKKVSAGEPPEVLSRLQSKHAREFVMLCLGYRDEDGNFIRPTVAELLQHPFLVKRANDDDEVVVDRPLRERTITETSGESMNGTPIVKRKVSMNAVSSILQQQQQQQNAPPQSRESSQYNESSSAVDARTPQPLRKRLPSAASSPQDEEDGDRFEEMQQSEISMRKVKVLMGRGQELKEDEEVQQDESDGGEGTSFSSDRINSSSQTQNSNGGQMLPPPPPPLNNQKPSPRLAPQDDHATAFHYLVAAAVIENENPNIRPHADDILKLVVTLPVDGQTQNVQFDFHLVEDDPVQVAKEMVKELGIPQGAVLEISETISGLACTARMKQDKYAVRLQNSQCQQQAPFQQGVQPTQQHLQKVQNSQSHLQAPFQQGVQPTQQHLQQHNQQFQNQGSLPGSQHEATQYQQEHAQQYQQQGVQSTHHLPRQGGIPVGPSQEDLSQYQQGLQVSLQHGQPQGNVPNGGSQSEQAQFHHHQGQQAVSQTQGAMSGSMHQQEHSMYQQGIQQGQQLQYQEPITNAGHHDQFQYQQHGSLPPTHVQHQGQMIGTGTRDMSQYQHQGAQQHMQHQVHHVQQAAIPNHVAPEPPHYQQQEPQQYQQSEHPQYQQVDPPHYQLQQQPAPSGGSTQEMQQRPRLVTQVNSVPDYASTAAVCPPMQQRQGSGCSEQAQIQEPPPMYAATHGGAYGQTHAVGDASQHPLQTPALTHVESSQQQQSPYDPAPVASSSPPPPPPTAAYPVTVGHVLNQPMPAQLHNATPGGNEPQPTQPGPLQPAAAIHSASMPPLPPSNHALSVQHLPIQGPDDGIFNPSAGEPGMPRDQAPLPDCSSQSPIVSHRSNSNGTAASTGHITVTYNDNIVDTGLDSDEEDVSDELRKLDDDFQKNLERAKKVFVNRMDNLQRSQIEREAQHLKTLEKHEKERAEFEKRLAQEAEQQQRRIEQLQREWDKRRETVALYKRKQKDGSYPLGEPNPDAPSSSSGSTTPGHLRNASTASSNFSISPAMSSHKLAQDPSGDGGQTER